VRQQVAPHDGLDLAALLVGKSLRRGESRHAGKGEREQDGDEAKRRHGQIPLEKTSFIGWSPILRPEYAQFVGEFVQGGVRPTSKIGGAWHHIPVQDAAAVQRAIRSLG
jgi:hypothetical protein